MEVWPKFARWLSGVAGARETAEDDASDGARGGAGLGLVLAAHNARFDLRFLVAELERGGIDRCVRWPGRARCPFGGEWE